MCRCSAWRGTVPMPSIRRVTNDVAGANHMDTVRICHHAYSLDKDEVLAVVMLVRHRPCSCTEVHRQGVQTRKHTRKLLHPDIIWVVEQSPELIRNRVSNRASGRAELIHRCCSNRGVSGCDVMRVNELLSLAGLEIHVSEFRRKPVGLVLGRRVAPVHLELLPPGPPRRRTPPPRVRPPARGRRRPGTRRTSAGSPVVTVASRGALLQLFHSTSGTGRQPAVPARRQGSIGEHQVAFDPFTQVAAPAGSNPAFRAAAAAAVASQEVKTHLAAVSSDGHIWHTVGRPGQWPSLQDVEAKPAAGAKPGDLTDVDCSDNLDLAAVSGDGHVWFRSSIFPTWVGRSCLMESWPPSHCFSSLAPSLEMAASTVPEVYDCASPRPIVSECTTSS